MKEEDIFVSVKEVEKMRREIEELKKQRDEANIAIGDLERMAATVNHEKQMIGDAMHSLKETVSETPQMQVPMFPEDIVKWIGFACNKMVEQHNYLANGNQGAGQWQMTANNLQAQLHQERAVYHEEKKFLEHILSDVQIKLKTVEDERDKLETSQIAHRNELKAALEKIGSLEKNAKSQKNDFWNLKTELKVSQERVRFLEDISTVTDKDIYRAVVNKTESYEKKLKEEMRKMSSDLEDANEDSEKRKKTLIEKDLREALTTIRILKKTAETTETVHKKELKDAYASMGNLEEMVKAESKKSVECQTDEVEDTYYNEENVKEEIEKMQKSVLSNEQRVEEMRKMLIGEMPSETVDGCTVCSQSGLLYRIRSLEELCVSKDSIIAVLNNRSLITEFELCQLREIIGLDREFAQLEENQLSERGEQEINENVVSSSSGIGEKRKALLPTESDLSTTKIHKGS